MNRIVKTLIFTLLTGILGSVAFGQNKINWLTWEEALAKHSVEKKKILVDVYTDWCGWCKKMEASTFSTDIISDYVNENYYPVKFNAEQKADINYKNKTYKFVKGFRRGYHELAFEIMNGRLSYPTVVFIDENLNTIQPIPGFQNVSTFEMIMTYFAEDHHKTTPWPKYEKTFVHQSARHNTDAVKKKARVVQPVKNKN